MTTLTKLLSIVVPCALGVTGQVLLKKGLSESGPYDLRGIVTNAASIFTNPYILVAIVLYATAFLLYLSILSRLHVSILYPVAVAINFTLLTLATSLFLGEPIHPMKILGLILILLGISCFFVSTASS